MSSFSSSSTTHLQSARPQAHPSSAPSQVRASVEALEIPTSQWGTVLTFVLGDLVGLLSVLGCVYLLTSVLAPGYAINVYTSLGIALPTLVGVFALIGLYQRRFTHPALEMQRMGGVTLLVGVIAGGTTYVTTESFVPAALIVAGGVVGGLVIPVCRSLFRILFARAPWWGFPAVIVSSESADSGILSTLNRWPEIGIRPVAFLSNETAPDAPSVPVKGGYELAPYLARHFNIPYAILVMPSLDHRGRANLLARYSKFFDHVFVITDPGGSPALWTTGRSGDGLFGYGVQHLALRKGAWLVKRVIDLVGASLLLLLLAPLLATIAVLLWMDSSGGVFYRQERMGREGRIFTVLKFRTMYEDADERLEEILANDPARRKEYERYHKLENDPRVTDVGEVLRQYSLDELPQLFNVLKGEMSLVGPRAYLPRELKKMNGLARAVLQSPPGITGLWQVSGRNQLSFASRVNLDVHYIQNWSPWLDLYLLVRTIPVVFSGEGAA